MIRVRCTLYALLFMLLPAVPALASRAKRGEKPPKALLVELLTRQNQVEYMQKNNPARVPEILHDIESVMKVTALDFEAHFDFIPVFFFIDTNAEKIKNGQFEGVLLDAKLQPVKQHVLQEGDTSFFVAYFGAFMPQPQVIKPGYTNTNNLGGYRETAGDDPTALKKTLLVMDHNFEMLQLPKPRTPNNYGDLPRKAYRKYSYRAKKSSFDYVPLASSYDATLRRYYRPRRVVYED